MIQGRRGGVAVMLVTGLLVVTMTGWLGAQVAPAASVAAAASVKRPKGEALRVVSPVWMSPTLKGKALASAAVWRGANGQALVITTAKLGNALVVIDGVSGKMVRSVGTEGLKLGQLGRPNGVAVWGDVAIVVERENQRLHAFLLPSFKPLGFYADTLLIKPVGLAVRPRTATTADLWVTDNQDLSPYPEEHAAVFRRRVKQFALTRTATGLTVGFVRAFGDTLKGGLLRSVESIGVDPNAEEVLIADEQVRDLNVYTTAGVFVSDFGQKHFHGQPEGLALVSCGTGDGYWIATDQSNKRNQFHLFERGSYQYLASFGVAGVAKTNGIAVLPGTVGAMNGALYVLNHDDNVAAVSLAAVWAAIGKAEPCAGGAANAAPKVATPAPGAPPATKAAPAAAAAPVKPTAKKP